MIIMRVDQSSGNIIVLYPVYNDIALWLDILLCAHGMVVRYVGW